MAGAITVTGIVLASAPIGDYDRRTVLLTKEFGKISAFAKGARRPNSALLACTQAFTFAEYTIYAGRGSYTLAKADHTNFFPELRSSMERMYYGMYFCELADYYTKENDDETEMLKLLYQSFRALGKDSLALRLVRVIFELRAAAINGQAPQVYSCVKCNAKTSHWFFCSSEGGLLCEACKNKLNKVNGTAIAESCVYAMQHIVSASIEKLYTFQVKEDILQQLEHAMKEFHHLYMDRRMKSLEVLDQI